MFWPPLHGSGRKCLVPLQEEPWQMSSDPGRTLRASGSSVTFQSCDWMFRACLHTCSFLEPKPQGVFTPQTILRSVSRPALRYLSRGHSEVKPGLSVWRELTFDLRRRAASIDALVIEELSPAACAKVAKCRTRVYTQAAARPACASAHVSSGSAPV